ncbi:MAG: hypothetical protein ACJ8KU_08720 [Chthoniobacterales bacterium]
MQAEKGRGQCDTVRRRISRRHNLCPKIQVFGPAFLLNAQVSELFEGCAAFGARNFARKESAPVLLGLVRMFFFQGDIPTQVVDDRGRRLRVLSPFVKPALAPVDLLQLQCRSDERLPRPRIARLLINNTPGYLDDCVLVLRPRGDRQLFAEIGIDTRCETEKWNQQRNEDRT